MVKKQVTNGGTGVRMSAWMYSSNNSTLLSYLDGPVVQSFSTTYMPTQELLHRSVMLEWMHA